MIQRLVVLDTSAMEVAVSQDGKYLAISHGLNDANTYKVTLWSLPYGEFITEVASSGKYRLALHNRGMN
jgi:hypothetical protein